MDSHVPPHPPTATRFERVWVGGFCLAGLVLYAVVGNAGLLAMVPVLLILVSQQRRENRARREAMARLVAELPALAPAERDIAVAHFLNRFPAWRERKRLGELMRDLMTPTASPRVLWIDAAGNIEIFRGVGDAEHYVEHWALDEHDLIVDEEGTRFEARAEKRLVRLQAVGTADWGAVCDRLARAGCAVRDEGVELLDALQARYGLTR